MSKLQLALRVPADQPGDTSRTIATLLGFAAVGIEDPVVDVIAGLSRCFEPQQLIKADAAPPIGQHANAVCGGQGQAITANQDKVVTQPVHFGERNAHAVINPGSE